MLARSTMHNPTASSTKPASRMLLEERLEIELGDKKPLFSFAEAKAESDRCLYCSDAPCIKACPTSIDIPTFIKKIASGNVVGSARTILEQNLLGYSCARVCPVEVLCAGSCVYEAWGREPIAIGRLQRYATEHALETKGIAEILPKAVAKRTQKIALIGAGPASLACAGYLALEGFAVTLFEKRAVAGGLNTTGIAPYKLQAEDSVKEVSWIAALGVEVKTGFELGKNLKGQDLLRDYDAVYLGFGLGVDSKLGIPGEDGSCVLGATAWIEQMKLTAAPKATRKKLGRVVVVGGGNTALDVARECAGLGAESVTLAYRRGEKEMSGYAHELSEARESGVVFLPWATPASFMRDERGGLTAMTFKKPDGSTLDLECDLVLVAIGQAKLKELAAEFPGVTLDARGCISASAENGKTGNPKVFAGGDCINGGKEVVNAVADGRNTARYLAATLPL
jgi:dihydropyrimidine dehydrogenase (NAD+) subunit PreT